MATSDQAPVLDPIEAWRRLRAAGRRPWLLLSAGAHPEARCSIVAFDPSDELRVHGDTATWTAPEGDRSGAARDMMDAFVDAVPRRPGKGFQGGLVGYLGFEAAALWMPLPPMHARTMPDVLWRICRGAYVVDHTRGTAQLHHMDAEGLAAARADIDATAPLPSPSLGSAGADAEASAAAGTDGDTDGNGARARIGAWRTSLDETSFTARVRSIQALIAAGDHFQTNIATQSQAQGRPDPATMLAALRDANPSPYMALLEWDGNAVVSGSPELLLEVRGGTIATRPIAGTRKRGRDAATDAAMEEELCTDTKERAEHTMLVDLLRNDIARVAEPGTVRVTELGSVERYRHVMHLASRVEGRMRGGTRLVDWLEALFPGGTVTGAPKLRATQRIVEHEPVPRGPYTGSVGYLSVTGDSAWNILIRTLVVEGDRVSVHAGSGIVADSRPGQEWREAGRKAQALLEAAEGRIGPEGDRLGDVTHNASWHPPEPPGSDAAGAARVLLVDNDDSFVHNLADYCAALGAQVRVVSCHDDVTAHLASFQATHVILSPGPGRPEDAGCTPRLAAELVGRLPVLGVCLGHQALAHAAGARIDVQPAVHGKADQVHHEGGLLAHLPSPFTAARYHSLVVDPASLPDAWRVTARLADGTVMAMEHRQHSVVGLQFHPESICTEGGLATVARFLELA